MHVQRHAREGDDVGGLGRHDHRLELLEGRGRERGLGEQVGLVRGGVDPLDLDLARVHELAHLEEAAEHVARAVKAVLRLGTAVVPH